jgi:4'-phosphopantetheinyl transferase
MVYSFLNDTILYQRRSIDLVQKNKQDVNVNWQRPFDFAPIGEADVDIWHARCDSQSTDIKYLTGLLSADEKKRSELFRFDRDRLRHVFSRGVLRLILSKYLEVPPAQIEIIIGSQGKPVLAHQKKEHSIHFNLSHSSEAVLYAVTKVGAIGVDVEKIRDIPDIENIIGRYFSSWERTAFSKLPATQKKQAFFSCWSRKEAFIKALGAGPSPSLDEFDVSILPDQPASLLHTHWDPSEVNNWLLSDIWLDAGHAAAMAINISGLNSYDGNY